jgi:xylulokinase
VAFSVLYPALIPLDAAGRALRPAILYSDQRSVRQLDWLRQKIGADEIFRTRGNAPSVGTCSLTSLLWLKENEPAIFDRARFFAHANSYLAARLTGVVAMDWTNAALTGLFETGSSFTWSPRLTAAAGVPMEKLPPVLPPCAVLGAITKEAAADTGLRPGTPVCLGAGDTACSSFGVGLVAPGDICLTCGTTDNLAVCVDAPRFDRRFATSAHVLRDRWLLIGTMSHTGGALEWIAQCSPSPTTLEQLFDAAAGVPSGADGLIFLPYLQGERSPVWDPHARGVFFGLSPRTRWPHMVRAVLEGCAFAVRQNVEIAEEILGRPVSEIKIMGGAARSAVWNAIRADVLQKPLRPVPMRETSLLGAAMVAAVGSGLMKTPLDAVRSMQARPADETLRPDPAAPHVYDPLYRTYLRLYPALRDLFREAANP